MLRLELDALRPCQIFRPYLSQGLVTPPKSAFGDRNTIWKFSEHLNSWLLDQLRGHMRTNASALHALLWARKSVLSQRRFIWLQLTRVRSGYAINIAWRIWIFRRFDLTNFNELFSLKFINILKVRTFLHHILISRRSSSLNLAHFMSLNVVSENWTGGVEVWRWQGSRQFRTSICFNSNCDHW